MIKNTLNPSWQEVFTLPFTFGASTLITVAVYDCISGEDFLDLRKHKGMGTGEFDSDLPVVGDPRSVTSLTSIYATRFARRRSVIRRC